MKLSGPGLVLVNTDVHGNYEDFVRLRAIYEGLCARHPIVHWVILGDIVHAPSPDARARLPELYDFEDGSWPIARDILACQEAHPGRVHFVLGNHDYAHIGGSRTAKFYRDEAGHLEAQLSPEAVEAMHALFGQSHLAVATSCGVLLTHGAPDDTLESWEEVEAVRLPPETDRERALIHSFTMYYGQPLEMTTRVLERVSQDTGFAMTVVAHGHDRDEEGYFVENERLVCPCIFGAPRENKRYLLLDLSEHYADAEALREGVEVLPLYEGT